MKVSIAAALVMAACGPAAPLAPPTLASDDPSGAWARVLDGGSTAALVAQLRAELARAGATFPSTLRLEEERFFDPRIDYGAHSTSLHLPALPSDGRGFWNRWSQHANLDELRGDFTDAEALLAARYAVLALAAHQLGHAAAEHALASSPYADLRELAAERVAVALMQHLDRIPELKAARAVYREIGKDLLLLAAVPRVALSPGTREVSLPDDRAIQATVLLARQEHLFESERPLASVIASELVARPDTTPWSWSEVAASSVLLPPPLGMEANPPTMPIGSSDPVMLTGIDSTGGVRSFEAVASDVTLGSLVGLQRETVRLPRFLRDDAFAADVAFTDVLFASDGALFVVTTGRLVRVLRVEPAGEVTPVLQLDPREHVRFALTETDHLVALSWELPGRLVARWYDAAGRPRQRQVATLPREPLAVAPRDDGTLYYIDPAAPAIWQWKDNQVERVVGERRGFADATDPRRVELFHPRQLRVLGDGSLAVIDETRDARGVRTPVLRTFSGR